MNEIDLLSTSENRDINQSHFSLCKNPATYGCGKIKCPCQGKWINCSYHVDINTQLIRLKIKNQEHSNNIKEWYDVYFRQSEKFHDLYCSG